ncbi:hypothetical protein BX616_001551 [Lobosporangium transversale]|uniref:Uncharacterized protein n=1 Tax=Lobosporangium transversale TaxID=64571 RepID=A0A1Y2GXC8_9FUNG|nr:hypothetical protein BCR41DRAFT_347112 [Lobosporangium transversale]KAF9903730.1 hypothetical protein BX616_001551 [Lobosporangium transversale]ORZ26949.1 hypothetical protein BCR41DRAFT_347112 [Lobosporangium transversale]|eukprot:XP_021884696.1 hypothetical protein BCR41DRAFT_347112 [Lobosporangium transversale]
MDPPSQAIHSGVVGFIVLIFIVARVLTTRGFAALRPGFNTRTIVTWLACTSLTLMTLYSALLAYILYKETMGGVYTGPSLHSVYSPASDPPSANFPINVSFMDMSENPDWDIKNMNITLQKDQKHYHALIMKPISLYSVSDKRFLFCLRIVIKLSQCTLMACLFLLNTYWCRHVEALVDEGDFMTRYEMYMYYILAALSIVLPVSTLIGIGKGTGDWNLATIVTDGLLLALGVGIIIGYVMTCIRLRALERDSRDVNGDDTSITFQLTYYVYSVYWLIGSMISILLLGILYKVQLVKADYHPVLARAINDLQGALWSTLVIMIYPAAMFLLYPSMDVLTKPENDPSSRFQKRERRTVKDAQRIRESLYVEGDSDGGHHSSLHALTTHPGLTPRVSESSQPQTPQRYSYYEPMRRERMGSITAMVNEMQLIMEEDGAGSIEMTNTPLRVSDRDSKLVDKRSGRLVEGGESAAIVNKGSLQAASSDGLGSNSPNAFDDDNLEQRAASREIEQSMPPGHPWSQSPMAFPLSLRTDTSEDFATMVLSAADKQPPPLTVQADINTAFATNKAASPTSTPKAVITPLTGILKTKSNPSNPPEIGGINNNTAVGFNRSSTAPPNTSASNYGARTSSIQGVQQTKKSNDNAAVRRRSSSASLSKPPLEVSASSLHSSAEPMPLSPTSQQRRSNVTGRFDAGALALATQLQHQSQHVQPRSSKPKQSKDGLEVDYFGLRKPSGDNSASTTPPPLPYEPQAQGIQPLEINMSPTMTGFLMADPYPSAGTRHFDTADYHDTSSAESASGAGADALGRRGSTGSNNSSKKYKAPPPPIPTEAANSYSKNTDQKASSYPATPTTPTTPPGVRPRRSVDTAIDPQLLEMANQMYGDHIVPVHILKHVTTPKTENPQIASSHVPPVSPSSSLQTMVSPPKSPKRIREPVESRAIEGRGGVSSITSPHVLNLAQTNAVIPPSPTSTETASPTITSPTTLPRPLTPAWYESKKTNLSSSTNDVLNHYNAVMRGSSYHKREQQQQLQLQEQPLRSPTQIQTSGLNIGSGSSQLYYRESMASPLDDTAQINDAYNGQILAPHPLQTAAKQRQQEQEQEQEQQQYKRNGGQNLTHSSQARMGSADSFGVVRRHSSGGKKDAPNQPIATRQELHQHEHDYQQATERHHQQQQQPPVGQIDRHSFMMASEPLSTYSTTWTGDLSDVTYTSGEVSVGAFGDRKDVSSSSKIQPHPPQKHHRRKSGEKTGSLSQSSSGQISGLHPSGDEQDKDNSDARKSQASGLSYSTSLSSRQSGGAYSNYSYNSGQGSDPIVVSASMSAAGLPSAAHPLQKSSSGVYKKRSSHAHNSNLGSTQNSVGIAGSTSEGSLKETSTLLSASTTMSRMNNMRLSAFGPGDDEEGIDSDADNDRVTRRESDYLDPEASLSNNASNSGFYSENSDPYAPQDFERKVQQEWMDRRAAVKKGSKNRLEQLQKQQQASEEQERLSQEQQQHYDQEEARQQRILQQQQRYDRQQRYLQLQQEQSKNRDDEIVEELRVSPIAAYSFSRTESTAMSVSSPSVPATTPPVESSASSMITTVITEPPSPSPNAQFNASASSTSPGYSHAHPSRPYGSVASPTFSTHSTHPSLHEHDQAYPQMQRHSPILARGAAGPTAPENEDLEPNPLIQSSASYALHRQNQLQRTSPVPPPLSNNLLHYDSIDSIATLRAHHRYPSAPSSPQPPRSIPSSPSPILQRPQLYTQHSYSHQPLQSLQSPQSPQSPRASLTVLGPSQYRITPEETDLEIDSNERSSSRATARTARNLSPVQRTSSRLTNLTNPESEYQWESAELNQHRWEMLEPSRRG